MADQSTPAPEGAFHGPQNITIRLDPAIAAGEYANFFQIRFNMLEMVLDFGRYARDIDQIDVVSRVILHPAQAGSLSQALQDNIRAYQEQFGRLAPEAQPSAQQIGFRTSSDLAQEGLLIEPPRRIKLPSDPGRAGG